MIYSAVASIIFCGYIIYDTDSMIKRHSYDDYIWAAVALYIDIVNLFLSLLTILRLSEWESYSFLLFIWFSNIHIWELIAHKKVVVLQLRHVVNLIINLRFTYWFWVDFDLHYGLTDLVDTGLLYYFSFVIIYIIVLSFALKYYYYHMLVEHAWIDNK